MNENEIIFEIYGGLRSFDLNIVYFFPTCFYDATQITLRLVWALQNVPDLQDEAKKGNALFGCIDSWLLYKFTGIHFKYYTLTIRISFKRVKEIETFIIHFNCLISISLSFQIWMTVQFRGYFTISVQ